MQRTDLAVELTMSEAILAAGLISFALGSAVQQKMPVSESDVTFAVDLTEIATELLEESDHSTEERSEQLAHFHQTLRDLRRMVKERSATSLKLVN